MYELERAVATTSWLCVQATGTSCGDDASAGKSCRRPRQTWESSSTKNNVLALDFMNEGAVVWSFMLNGPVVATPSIATIGL